MKKIFANFILIFTIFFNTSAFADKIDSIKIIGNKRISNETILLFSKISANSEIANENELNNIFKNLYETNFFSDIKISFENSILTIKVEENPVIQKVEFKGIKSNQLQENVYKNLIKSKYFSKKSNLVCIADDSGLEVDYLCGRPGIQSARYSRSGNDHENNAKLLKELLGVPDEYRTARFRCALAFVSRHDEPEPVVCSASWEGRILDHLVGDNGFGYDPLFFVAPYNCSAAELAPEIKNLVSHRAQASSLLLTVLEKLF